MQYCFVLFLAILSGIVSPTYAGSASWLASPTSSDWNNSGNWTPGGPPNAAADVATFSTSNHTAINLSAITELDGIVFGAGASAYSVTVSPDLSLTFSGAGITNNSGVAQDFIADSDTSGNVGFIYFIGNASAGSLTTIENKGGAAFPSQAFGGSTQFFGNSVAGSATVFNRSAVVNGAIGGYTIFYENSSAGNATITNERAAVSGASGGFLQFWDSSTAAFATITNQGGNVGDRGQTTFFVNSSAGHAQFVIEGASLSTGASGKLEFQGDAHAGVARCTAKGAAVAGQPSAGGLVRFLVNSNAENGSFILNGGQIAGASGATALFSGTSTAANSTLTLDGGTLANATGGLLRFRDSASAGHALILAQSGTNGGTGGRIYFDESSIGEDVTISIYGDARLDISNHTRPGVSLDILQGDGKVFLGNCELVIETPSSYFANFSGIIQDGGLHGGVGGSLSTAGGGKLTLGNANTYSGGTTVNSGTLEVNHDGGLGSGDVSVGSGGTLFLDKGATNNNIADTAALKIVTGSTVHLAFNGNPEVIASLIVDGVPQPGGLYGSSTSGAPHPLPQFRNEGTILVVNTQAASRKAHGAAFFETTLPFSGKPAVECRSGGANGDYQLIVTFSRPVTYANAAVTSGIGSVQSTSGNNSLAITINLTGVANAQTITVTLSNVNYGGNTGNISIPVSFLIGDTSGNGSVNASDVSQTKTQSGQPLTNSNFREDVTANGSINTSDISLVKTRAGTSLP